MKYIKELAYLGYDIYTTLNKNDIGLEDVQMIVGTYNDVMDVEATDVGTASTTPVITLEDATSSGTKAQILPSSTSVNHFFYQQLDANGKLIYTKLEQNIPNLTKNRYTIDFSTQFNSLLHESTGSNALAKSFHSSISAFFYDHPELFYVDLSQVSMLTKSHTRGNHTTYYVSITPRNDSSYLYSQFSNEATLQQAISQVASYRQAFINRTSGSTYQKIKQVHDAIVNHVSYDTSYKRINNDNVYGAFVEKSVVCEGYAKTFKYIMDGLGIPCILVSGTGTNSSGETESHMWNYVQIDGAWYGIDATWDDPIIFVNGARQGETIRHTFLCRGTSSFVPSHIASGKLSDEGMFFNYPTLSQTDYK